MRHKHAGVIIAWANGAAIQIQDNSTGKWHDVTWNPPGWGDANNYRVKPEPKPDVVEYSIIKKGRGLQHQPEPREGSVILKRTWDGETSKLKKVEIVE